MGKVGCQMRRPKVLHSTVYSLDYGRADRWHLHRLEIEDLVGDRVLNDERCCGAFLSFELSLIAAAMNG